MKRKNNDVRDYIDSFDLDSEEPYQSAAPLPGTVRYDQNTENDDEWDTDSYFDLSGSSTSSDGSGFGGGSGNYGYGVRSGARGKQSGNKRRLINKKTVLLALSAIVVLALISVLLHFVKPGGEPRPDTETDAAFRTAEPTTAQSRTAAIPTATARPATAPPTRPPTATPAPTPTPQIRSDGWRLYDPDLRFYYCNTLDSDEQRLFDIVYDGIFNMQACITLPDWYRNDKVEKVLDIIGKDCPEVFWYHGSYSYQYGGTGTQLFPEYTFSSKASADEAYNNVIRMIRSIPCPDRGDEYLTETAIYRWIVENTVYDYNEYERPQPGSRSYSADAVYLTHKAVCDGFSRAFALACRMNGIMAAIVDGTGNGGPHAWNAVRIEGEWYQADVTWDCCGYMSDYPYPINAAYTYLNLTDQQMAADHEIKSWYHGEGRLPYCTSTDAAYTNRFAPMKTVDGVWVDDLLRQMIAVERGEQGGIMLNFSSVSRMENARNVIWGAIDECNRRIGSSRNYQLFITDKRLMLIP